MEFSNEADELQSRYPQLLKEFQRVLNEHGMGHLSIQGADFVSRPAITLQADGCPPGTIAKQVCKPKPGGGIRCETVCVPIGQAH